MSRLTLRERSQNIGVFVCVCVCELCVYQWVYEYSQYPHPFGMPKIYALTFVYQSPQPPKLFTHSIFCYSSLHPYPYALCPYTQILCDTK